MSIVEARVASGFWIPRQEARAHRPRPAADNQPRLRRSGLEDPLFHQLELPWLREPQDRRNAGAGYQEGIKDLRRVGRLWVRSRYRLRRAYPIASVSSAPWR